MKDYRLNKLYREKDWYDKKDKYFGMSRYFAIWYAEINNDYSRSSNSADG